MIKGELLKSMGNFDKAAQVFESMMAQYQWEPKAAAATFFAAQLYDEQLNNKEKALDYYKRVLMDYPLSIFQPDFL